MGPRTPPGNARRLQRGGIYLWLLLALTLLGLGLGRALDVYHHEIRRQQEVRLLYVGEQFRLAIASYYRSSPGGVGQYPATLEDLVTDSRFFTLQRHLRRIYSDPVVPGGNWGLVRDGNGRIQGIYSMAAGIPVKQDGFPAVFSDFRGAQSYSEWRFVYTPDMQ